MKIFSLAACAALAAVLVATPAFAAGTPDLVPGDVYNGAGGNFAGSGDQFDAYGGTFTDEGGGPRDPPGDPDADPPIPPGPETPDGVPDTLTIDNSFNPVVGTPTESPDGTMIWRTFSQQRDPTASILVQGGAAGGTFPDWNLEEATIDTTVVEMQWTTVGASLNDGGPYAASNATPVAFGLTDIDFDAAFKELDNAAYIYWEWGENGIDLAISSFAKNAAAGLGGLGWGLHPLDGIDPAFAGREVLYLRDGTDPYTAFEGTNNFDGKFGFTSVNGDLNYSNVSGLLGAGFFGENVTGVVVGALVTVVPEPTSGLFLASLACGAGAVVRRRRK